MKTVAIVQARMSSTRLPGKVLRDLGGRTVLDWVTTRVRRSGTIDEVVVATTTGPQDDAIVDACRKLDVGWHRGSELDVLDRYYQAATERHADAVVRITSDCPLIDAVEIDRVVTAFLVARPSYATNALPPGFIRGLDTEVMTMESLACAWREARADYQRVHVTPFLYQNPDRFRILVLPAPVPGDFSDLRWCVDTAADLEMVNALVSRLADDRFGWREALAVAQSQPTLTRINAHVRQKRLEEG